MKKEDFERLKAVCEKEGFWVDDNHRLGLFHIMVKDIWDGVEFVESHNGSIYKILGSDPVYTFQVIIDGEELTYTRDSFKPSTESAYIEQLIKEAHERFGEIKECDRFEIGGSIELTVDYRGMGFRYYKDEDLLCFKGYHLYRQGKWATRVKERVKVEYEMASTKDKNYLNLSYKVSRDIKGKEIAEIALFLASQLEDYLNGEAE